MPAFFCYLLITIPHPVPLPDSPPTILWFYLLIPHLACHAFLPPPPAVPSSPLPPGPFTHTCSLCPVLASIPSLPSNCALYSQIPHLPHYSPYCTFCHTWCPSLYSAWWAWDDDRQMDRIGWGGRGMLLLCNHTFLDSSCPSLVLPTKCCITRKRQGMILWEVTTFDGQTGARWKAAPKRLPCHPHCLHLWGQEKEEKDRKEGRRSLPGHELGSRRQVLKRPAMHCMLIAYGTAATTMPATSTCARSVLPPTVPPHSCLLFCSYYAYYSLPQTIPSPSIPPSVEEEKEEEERRGKEEEGRKEEQGTSCQQWHLPVEMVPPGHTYGFFSVPISIPSPGCVYMARLSQNTCHI